MPNAHVRLAAALLTVAGVLLAASADQALAQSSQPRLVVFEGFYRPT